MLSKYEDRSLDHSCHHPTPNTRHGPTHCNRTWHETLPQRIKSENEKVRLSVPFLPSIHIGHAHPTHLCAYVMHACASCIHAQNNVDVEVPITENFSPTDKESTSLYSRTNRAGKHRMQRSCVRTEALSF